LLPVVGLPIKAGIGAAEVALVAWAVGVYVHWQLRREASNQPIAPWEWSILALALAALIASVVALALALIWLAAALEMVVVWLK
jgi:hypothetical protein